ncbi:reverse transcriptase domain-containing protein [Tanacetum coccineum]
MPKTRQGMSFAEIEQIVAQRVTNAIECEIGYQNNSGQQNKQQKVVRAYIVRPDNKNGYAGKLPLYNKCKVHHTSPCTVNCNYKRVGHMTRDSRTPVPTTTQRPSVENPKTIVTCYKCGKQGHYRSEFSNLKNHNYGNQKGNEGKAHGDPNVVADNANT